VIIDHLKFVSKDFKGARVITIVMKMTSRHIKSSNDFLKKNTKFSALGRFPRKGGGSLWFTHKDYAGSLNPRATSIPQSNH